MAKKRKTVETPLPWWIYDNSDDVDTTTTRDLKILSQEQPLEEFNYFDYNR